MDSFVWVWVCICVHIRQPQYKKSNKQRNGRKDDQRYWEAPTLQGLLPGQDDSPSNQFYPHQSLWSQSSSCRLHWKQSWPFPALAAVGYGLWKGCDPHPSITLPDFYCFLFLSSDLISIVHTVLFGICVLAHFSDLWILAAKGVGSLLYRLLDSCGFRVSFADISTGMATFKKLQSVLSSPFTNSPMSLLLHGFFWLLLSNSELWCWHTRLWYWWCSNWSLFYCCTHCKSLKTSTSAKWL